MQRCVILAALFTNGRFPNGAQSGMSPFIEQGFPAIGSGSGTAVGDNMPHCPIQHNYWILLIRDHHLELLYRKAKLHKTDIYEGNSKLEIGDFYGLETRIWQNEQVRLEFLAQAGPRIVRLSLAGSLANLLAEVPEFTLTSANGLYYIRGGHRLWHAPETAERTYIPDDDGLTIEETSGSLHLIQPTERPTGIRKSIEIELDPDRPAVTLHHHLRNEGLWSVQLAPWAITQMRLGGVAVLPQQLGALDTGGYLPNRQFALWSYSQIQDPRLQLGDDFILVETEPTADPFKIGCLNRQGWLAYLWQDILFVKRFKPQPDQLHVDMGCNAEIYVNDQFLELETLAPLQTIEPGETITHTEKWELYSNVPQGQPVKEVVAKILMLAD
jgi:hypothetical protein